MRRAANLLGTGLIVVGVAILAYVGVQYWQNRAPASPHWNAAQKSQGSRIAAAYSGRQKVAIPKSLVRAAPAGSEPALRMVIPKIGVDAPVVQTAPVSGVWEVADWSVGHLSTTPNPGGLGNGAYSAHDDIKGEIFKRLGELSPGDQILLYTQHSVYTYAVTNELTVDPSDVSVLAPTKSSTVTLISCVPYWVDTQRLIIKGVLKSRSSV
jgi:sortase A